MQPSLAQIAIALVAVALIAVLAVVFDSRGADSTHAKREVDLPAPSSSADGRTPVIRTEGGRPIPRVESLRYERGEVVRLVVASDQRDVVHVRGSYGIKAPVNPGDPALVEFRARQTGRFEVELDRMKNRIASLSVTR